jgi:predicted GIY-YIG superfamily endonuclease
MYNMDINKNMKYKTYIYGLYQDNKLIYVGKTCNPKERLVNHKPIYKGNLHMVILDIYNDLELLWVEKFMNEGHELKNKENNESGVDSSWEIGDKIVNKDLKIIPIRDTELDILYPSLSEFEKSTGIHYQKILYQLTKAKNTKECYRRYVLEENN